jgi:hypothetical protein
MKFFDLDSPLMQVLNKVADLLWLNILTLICCIPIVTVGASLTAMNYMALKIVRNEECYITKGFFKSFKQNFRQATAIWLLFLLAVLVLAGDFYIMKNSGIEFNIVIKVVIGIVALILTFTWMFVFPVLAKFDNTVIRTIKNAFVMSILQFPKTLLMIVMYALPIVIGMLVPQAFPICFLFGLSAPAYVSALLYNKFFKKLEDQYIAATTPAEEEGAKEEDAERIFKDELDESLIEGTKDKE